MFYLIKFQNLRIEKNIENFEGYLMYPTSIARKVCSPQQEHRSNLLDGVLRLFWLQP